MQLIRFLLSTNRMGHGKVGNLWDRDDEMSVARHCSVSEGCLYTIVTAKFTTGISTRKIFGFDKS